MGRVLVTGAASGIGAGTAEHLADAGWEVVRTDRVSGPDLVELDVSRPDQWAHVMAERGPFDALVNCAGIRRRKGLLELTPAEWSETVEINLTGTFLGTQAFARAAVEAGRQGAVVNIASVNSFKPIKGQPHYCASKAGVAMLTMTAALELAEHNIRVNAIAPGAIETPMLHERIVEPGGMERTLHHIPRGRLGQPTDIAHGVSYLLSEGADYVTGIVLTIDGGFVLR